MSAVGEDPVILGYPAAVQFTRADLSGLRNQIDNKGKNMKKIKCILFSLIIATCFMPAFAFADEVCSHEFQGANLIEEGTCIYCGETGEKVVKDTYIKKFTNESSTKIPTEVKNLLVDFFDTFYDSQVYLEHRDITKYFSKTYYTSAQKNQVALDTMIDGRKLQNNDLRLTDASYSLKLVSVKKVSDREYKINARDSAQMYFKFMQGTKSEMLNVKCSFTVIKTKSGAWKLKTAYRKQNFYLDFDDAYSKVKHDGFTHDQIDAALAKIKSERIEKYKAIKAQEEKRLVTSNTKTCKVKECDHKIDRDACLDYAMNHIKKNRTVPDYSNWGGNCQNFSSNVLLAGGIPMDTKGPAMWKHYSSTLDNSSAKKGRTASFVIVGSFYNYAKLNTGYGLAARTDVNPYFGEAGDVLQVGNNGFFSHTMVVVGNVKNDKGEIVDLLLNGNTIDTINFPLSAYGCVERRLIKVYGWND